MIGLAPSWKLSVERGPDLLFVKVHAPADGRRPAEPLADSVWTVLRQSFTHRVVLELDQIGHLGSYLISQLLLLKKKVEQEGGLLRVCGLSEANRRALAACQLDGCFPNFERREHALLGSHPSRPR